MIPLGISSCQEKPALAITNVMRKLKRGQVLSGVGRVNKL